MPTKNTIHPLTVQLVVVFISAEEDPPSEKTS